MSSKRIRRPDWPKFCMLKTGKTRRHLEKLCSEPGAPDIGELFRSPDSTGLLPIHWAAMHNRGDLIEFMLDQGGSPLTDRCSNKLLGCGTALHLAAMNGAIEAAGLLLDRYRDSQTEPKRLEVENGTQERKDQPAEWINMLDADGQTPLMRSASPSEGRLEVVRELLRKNLWSLGGRPAEMALYLIARGARVDMTDPKTGLNALHWAIVNDHDDIAHLLIALDPQMGTLFAKLLSRRPGKYRQKQKDKKRGTTWTKVDLDDKEPRESNNMVTDRDTQPLISEKDRARRLVSDGLSPLQLAILYGRPRIIQLLWKYRNQSLDQPAELSQALVKASYANPSETFRYSRQFILKCLLIIDLSLMVLLWIPVYLRFGTSIKSEGPSVWTSIRSGAFLFTSFMAGLLAFRVMLTKPGYLSRNSTQYTKELSSLVGRSLVTDQPEVGNSADDSREKKNSPTGVNSSNEMVGKRLTLEERVRLLCHRCRCIRRYRTRHCLYCNHCIQDFDHHCAYLSNCVGRRNRIHFLVMMLMVMVAGIYGTILQWTFLPKVPDGYRHGWWKARSFWHTVGLISVAKYAVIGAVNSFCILKRACQGVTLYEDIRSRRIQSTSAEREPNEYIKRLRSTIRGNFWRFNRNRFLTGDLSADEIIRNLKEFCNFTNINAYLISVIYGDSALKQS